MNEEDKREEDLIWWAKTCAYAVITFGIVGFIVGLVKGLML
jgi:hypothetical protein